jgi:hypothetical protein
MVAAIKMLIAVIINTASATSCSAAGVLLYVLRISRSIWLSSTQTIAEELTPDK